MLFELTLQFGPTWCWNKISEPPSFQFPPQPRLRLGTRMAFPCAAATHCFSAHHCLRWPVHDSCARINDWMRLVEQVELSKLPANFGSIFGSAWDFGPLTGQHDQGM